MPIPSRFNIQNVLGVPGAAGPAGPAGPTGATGATGAAGSGSPTGAAGGDLGGTYPNPEVAGIDGVAVTGGAPAAGSQLVALSPTSMAWSGDGTKLAVPAASGYTVVGEIGLLQSGTAVLALHPNASTSSTDACLIAQTLAANAFWTVTLQCKDTGYVAGNTSYPGVGAAVSTGATGGSSVVYDMSRYYEGSYQGMHGQQSTLSGTRTAVYNEIYGASFDTGGLYRARLLCDATNLHFQWSCDGIFWTDLYSMACPASLTYYGFSMGSGSGSGATGQIAAMIYDNTYTPNLTIPQRTITAVSNTAPIQITTSANHGFVTGDIVAVLGTGVTNANSGVGNGNFSWRVIVTGLNTFTLIGSSAGGTGSTGTATCISR